MDEPRSTEVLRSFEFTELKKYVSVGADVALPCFLSIVAEDDDEHVIFTFALDEQYCLWMAFGRVDLEPFGFQEAKVLVEEIIQRRASKKRVREIN